MSELMIVAGVAYAGICVGTYIGVSNSDMNWLSKIYFAIVAPVPVFVLLILIAASIAREEFKTIEDFKDFPILLALSLAMYADAVVILSRRPTTRRNKKVTHMTAYRYGVPRIRRAIVNNFAMEY